MPSQKQCETNPSREQKNAAVVANRISRRKVTITSLTKLTAVSTTNLHHERNEMLLLMQVSLRKFLGTRYESIETQFL